MIELMTKQFQGLLTVNLYVCLVVLPLTLSMRLPVMSYVDVHKSRRTFCKGNQSL